MKTIEDCLNLAAKKWPGFEALHGCIISMHGGVEVEYKVSIFKPMIAGGYAKEFREHDTKLLYNTIKGSTWWKAKKEK